MFENIIDAVKQEIRVEVAKDDIDLAYLNGLIDVANGIQRRTGESVGEVLPAYGVSPTRLVGAPARTGYEPAPMERFTELAEGILRQQAARGVNLYDLVSSFVKLKDIEPNLAERLKKMIEDTISQEEKKRKEATDESLHSDIPG